MRAAPPPVWEPTPTTLALPPDEVHVWRAALDLDAAQIQNLRALLSQDESQRADQFRFPLHRHRFIAARGRLRTVLARYLNTAPQQLQFSYGPHGKPALAAAAAATGLRFNLAHSAGLALFAVAQNREVGVDLESLGRDRAAAEIAERFFSPHETAALRALPEAARRRAFYDCWARKEAYLKARGLGLALPLDQFAVSLAPGEPARLLASAEGPAETSRWQLRELPAGEGFAAALAAEGSDWRLRCWEW